ncbi:MAG: PadR family transcriptional regulator [Gemmatimonadetes bacterium]|nr:PadR family transcriptional regulator [Gemmatimonadota bacterium]
MLRSNWFQVLLALADAPAHGSEVARRVKSQTEGSTTLWPATLYRTLDEMSDSGLIRELVGSQHPEGASEKRRYYRITPEGSKALRESADRMASWAASANQRLERRRT